MQQMQYKNVCVRGQYFSVCFQALSVMSRDCARAVTAVNFQKVNEKKCKYSSGSYRSNLWRRITRNRSISSTCFVQQLLLQTVEILFKSAVQQEKLSLRFIRLQTDNIQAFPPSWGKPHEGEEVLCLDMSSGMTGMSIN